MYFLIQNCILRFMHWIWYRNKLWFKKMLRSKKVRCCFLPGILLDQRHCLWWWLCGKTEADTQRQTDWEAQVEMEATGRLSQQRKNKNSHFPWNIGCLIAILLLVYYTPPIAGYIIPYGPTYFKQLYTVVFLLLKLIYRRLDVCPTILWMETKKKGACSRDPSRLINRVFTSNKQLTPKCRPFTSLSRWTVTMSLFSRNTKPKQQQQQQQQQQQRQQLCSQPCTVHHSSHVIGFIGPVLTCHNLPFLRGGNRHGIFNLLTCGSSAAGLLLPNRLILPALGSSSTHQFISCMYKSGWGSCYLPTTKIYQIFVSILWSSLNPTTQPIVVSFPLSTTGVRLGLPESIILSQESDLS